jgi:hypothetical protein
MSKRPIFSILGTVFWICSYASADNKFNLLVAQNTVVRTSTRGDGGFQADVKGNVDLKYTVKVPALA